MVWANLNSRFKLTAGPQPLQLPFALPQITDLAQAVPDQLSLLGFDFAAGAIEVLKRRRWLALAGSLPVSLVGGGMDGSTFGLAKKKVA